MPWKGLTLQAFPELDSCSTVFLWITGALGFWHFANVSRVKKGGSSLHHTGSSA